MSRLYVVGDKMYNPQDWILIKAYNRYMRGIYKPTCDTVSQFLTEYINKNREGVSDDLMFNALLLEIILVSEFKIRRIIRNSPYECAFFNEMGEMLTECESEIKKGYDGSAFMVYYEWFTACLHQFDCKFRRIKLSEKFKIGSGGRNKEKQE